jgi:multidrug efflux pump subunit AcrA (membrane-fusion protein)
MSRDRRLSMLVLGALLLAGAPADHAVAQEHRHDGREARPTATRQLWTCGMHPQILRDEPGLCPICHMKLTPVATDVTAPADGAVVIDPTMVQNMGVRFAEVRRADLGRAIRATGYLDQAEPNVRDVSLRVSGWIETLHADTVGIHVAAGAPLFELYSPELQVAVDELIASRRAGSADAGVGATLVQAARRKLERYGLRAAEIDRLGALDRAPRTVTFMSPITGHVTEKLVVAGAAVKAGDRVMQIVDHSTLWLDLQVHPQDLPAVAIGNTVEATVEGASEPVRGDVFFVHPHLDPDTRTATVRARIPNPGLRLRPGMYATARLRSTVARDALVVPREAVIDTGRRRFAFVALGTGRFAPRDVGLGESGEDGLVAVTSGLAEGERVVISGQFLLDAESRTQEAIQKYLGVEQPKDAAR